MKNRPSIVVALVFGVSVCTTASAQDLVTVDTSSVVADLKRKPIGINVNFLLDDDANRPGALQSLAQALRMAGVKYLRYPGGEKSDGYLWSVPPYTSSVPTLARWAAGEYPTNQEWPSYDRNLVQPDGRTFRTAPLDFDEFMQVCRDIGCVPTIVVCYDSMYKPAQTGGVAPTRAQLLETAREWVRYANVTRGYNVKYWEIGNESYLPHYNGSASATDYARDLIEFSRVMKGVDPTIRIGANGNADSWWRTILSTASGAIDFLSVHNYPATGWGDYSYYQNNSVNLVAPVQTAQRAIQMYAPQADRERLLVAVTEINSVDWAGGWPHRNDMGHALALFDMFGAHLANPKVVFTQLWNTRWSGNDTATTPALWDALNRQNDLQATGRATAIWGAFLKEQLVRSSNTAMVRSYATYSASNGRLSVFLINKDTAPRTATVTIYSGSPRFTAEVSVFAGLGTHDLYPTWLHHGTIGSAENAITVSLAPVSVTVLDVTPDAMVHSAPGVIQAEDFANRAYSDTTPGNAGGLYRATDVDIQQTTDSGGGFNVGWIAAGEWLEYAIQVPRAGYYDLQARVASRYPDKSFRFLLNGQDLTGSIGIPNTGGWQTWATVTRTGLYLPAGTHRARVATNTGGFNFNWIALVTATGVTHAVPGIIQAEDFADTGYWDSTPGNGGGSYRSTDVDIQPTSDAGGGFNVGWITAGERLEYAVRVTTAGYYDLSARLASRYTGKSFAVLLNGTDLTGKVTVPYTGGWQTWETVTRRGLYLPAGTHRLRFVASSDGFNLNWFSFAPPFDTPHALPGTIQAEDFNEGAYWDSTAGNRGNAYRATDVDIEPASDAGGGFNIGWVAAGEWQEYTIHVAAAGYYDFSARVASPNSGRTFRILVNGTDVSGTLNVPNTGGYQTWQTVTRSRIYLAAGTHRLRSVAIDGAFNLNWMSFVTSQ